MRIQKRPHLILQENILHAKQYRVILKEKRKWRKRGQIILLEVSFGLPKFFKPVMTAGLEQNGTSHGQHQHHAFRVSSARFDVASLVCRS
jgi:hypothetical protein